MPTPNAFRASVLIGVLLASAGSAPADDFQLEEGFTRLDGTDLESWTGNLAGWSVADGAIHLDAKQSKGSIYSRATHGANCIIRLQFRATPRADSGVFIHGKQLQVRDYPTAGPKPYAGASRPAGQWNDLEWDITEGVAVVRLNGEVIEPAWKIGNNPQQGLGLQRESGDFDFRRIRIQEKP